MRLLHLAVAVLTLLPTVSNSQETITVTSNSDDLSRPVSTIVSQIRKQSKISITYEDPRYANQADIVDVTSEVARVPDAEKAFVPRILAPNGHPITFVYSPADMSTLRGAQAVLERLVHEYGMPGGPTFGVVRSGTRLHVIPNDFLAANGQRLRQNSILDTPVSLPAGRRDGGHFLQELCDRIFEQTGYKVDIGPGSIQTNEYLVRSPIENRTVRSLLEQFWDSTSAPGSFVWDLYYDPSDKSYGLSFRCVRCAGLVQEKLN